MMGAPGITWFCENGHVVEQVEHYYILENNPIECPHCHSSAIKTVFEWGDPEYEPDSGWEVPTTPLTYETKRITVRIPIYDVSRLFSK